MGVKVRNIVSADRDAVRTMLVDCGAFSDVEIAVALEVVDQGLLGEYVLLAAEVNGETMAFAAIGPASMTVSAWYLYWICVHPKVQRSSVGRVLQASIETLVAKSGGNRLVLETSGRPDYDRSRRFYENAGFVEVGRIPDFYRLGDDCVVYCKTINLDG